MRKYGRKEKGNHESITKTKIRFVENGGIGFLLCWWCNFWVCKEKMMDFGCCKNCYEESKIEHFFFLQKERKKGE